jgi:hypothetical protein
MTQNAEGIELLELEGELGRLEGLPGHGLEPRSGSRPGFELADNIAMELPGGSGLKVFGTLFPARVAGARAAIGAANELRAAEAAGGAEEGETVWLTVPYGVYAHPRGTQVVDEESALAMARHFGQIWARLARKFRGLPVYIGHPDARGRSPEEQEALAREYPDKRAYGWVEALEAGDEGLRALVRWGALGRELVRREAYAYFSPHWGMLPILEQPGMYRPVELFSLGLTNHPNIPGLTLKQFPAPEPEDEVVPELEEALNAVFPPVAEEETEEARLRVALNEERRGRCRLTADRAVEDGRIPAAAREQWVRNLELDFAGNERLLEQLPSAWNTASRNPVRVLGDRKGWLGLEEGARVPLAAGANAKGGRADRIGLIAREVLRRQEAGDAPGFHEVYQGVKRDHPEWFAEG